MRRITRRLDRDGGEIQTGGQKARWCPLGEGAVQKSFFDWLKTTNFTGPISQHHEYDGLGTGAEMVKHLQRDLVQLRTWLAG